MIFNRVDGYVVSTISLPFGNVLRYARILLTAFINPCLDDMLKLLIAEVA
jgi:hypothetical protein